MKKIITGISSITGLIVAAPALAGAANLSGTVGTGFNYASVVGFGTQELRTTIFLVVNILMGFLGIIAVLIILAGGFKWMTAGGNEEKVAEAKKLIIAGIVGIAIILGSFAIATFVVNSLINATT